MGLLGLRETNISGSAMGTANVEIASSWEVLKGSVVRQWCTGLLRGHFECSRGREDIF